jgi:hypothetical protein
MRRQPREKSAVDYVFGACFQLGVLVAINLWPKWVPLTFGVVTPAFAYVVWAANLAATVELLRCLVLAATRPGWLFELSKMISGVASFISTAAFLAVFPFDFSHFGGPVMNPLVRICLLIALAASTLSVVIHAARFIFGQPLNPASRAH